jgi:hypothetical protein
MSVKITLACDGCFKESGPHMLPHREFKSFDGRGYGFGVWTDPGLRDVPIPAAWVMSDPYTGCTYCPDCWAEITADEEPTMKTTIKRGLLAAAFTTALGAAAISKHGQEWRHALHYAPDFLAGFAGMAVIVAAFVGVLGAACLGTQWGYNKLLGDDA